MTVYIDSEFICHPESSDGLIAIEEEFFDGKCPNFISGFRVVPEGHSWTRNDGMIFNGPMRTTIIDYNILKAYQDQYDETLAEMNAAYREGVESI